MYLEYFGFNEIPFSLTPNTNYFCNLITYNEALNVIMVSLRNGEGFIKVVGEVGTGKTLLCRKLLNSLEDEYVTAYIANSNLDTFGLHEVIAKELGVKYPKDVKQHELLNLLNERLLDIYKTGKRVVVVIDEAQVLPDNVLEALRLLSNLETESSKLLHIILFGQPELDIRLEQVNLRQLKQRIAFAYNLRPLTRNEMDDYICYRLGTAGYKFKTIFSHDASDLLFKASGGIPRLINILCNKALLAAYGFNQKQVTAKIMSMAIDDTDSIVNSVKTKHYKYYLIILAILILALGIECYLILRLYL